MHICLDNDIGHQGACALAESLKYNTTLTQLNLEGKLQFNVSVFNKVMNSANFIFQTIMVLIVMLSITSHNLFSEMKLSSNLLEILNCS